MSEYHILMVDDEPNVLSAYRRTLGKKFNLKTCTSGAEGLAELDATPGYAVVVTDMRMPEMSGIEFLQAARQKYPDTVYMMLTGNADQQTAIDAINKGHVFRYLNKPCPPEILELAIQAAIAQYELLLTERTLLQRTLTGSIKLLLEALAISAPETGEATRQIRNSVHQLANELGIEVNWQLTVAASLSMLGCIVTPNFDEQEPLSDAYLVEVARSGAGLLRHIPRLEVVAEIIAAQRATGEMPASESKDENSYWVEIGGRLIRFALDWHRASLGADHADGLRKLQTDTGGIYDPKLLAAARAILDVDVIQKQKNPPPKQYAVDIHDLHTGDILEQDVQTNDQVLLVGKGHELTQMMIERLRGFDKAGLLASSTVAITRPERKRVRREAA